MRWADSGSGSLWIEGGILAYWRMGCVASRLRCSAFCVEVMVKQGRAPRAQHDMVLFYFDVLMGSRAMRCMMAECQEIGRKADIVPYGVEIHLDFISYFTSPWKIVTNYTGSYVQIRDEDNDAPR